MADVAVYIVGGTDENELVLQSALVAFCDALQILLRNQVERRSVLENFDLVMLCLDETIDNGCVSLPPRYGIVFFRSLRSHCSRLFNSSYVFCDRRIILETDAACLASRVSKPRPDVSDITINEQTLMNAYQTVKERMQQRIGQF